MSSKRFEIGPASPEGSPDNSRRFSGDRGFRRFGRSEDIEEGRYTSGNDG